MKVVKLIVLIVCVLGLIFLAYSEILKVELIAIISALVLGVAGLFQDWIKSQFYYPELEINFKVEQPDCHKTIITYKHENGLIISKDCYYYRLKILNKGNIRANKVEVIIRKKYTEDEMGKFVEDKNFLPLNLKWSHDGVIIRESIAPSLSRYCDFGHIDKPDLIDLLKLDLDLEVKPNTGSNFINPNKHRFEITAVADNSNPVTKIFEIEFDYFWDDNEKYMLEKGLNSKEVKNF